MTRFLHLTDIHISAPETEDPFRADHTVPALERFIAMLDGMETQPEFILATGDMTNVGAPADYALIRELTARIKIPILWAMGNHDDRMAFRNVFTEYPGTGDETLDYDQVIAGLHVIVLDSLDPGATRGALSAAQCDWLSERLGAHPDLPKIIGVHHPPKMSNTIYDWASLDSQSTERFAAALAGRQVTAIFSGHIHMTRTILWNGVAVIVTMGQQSGADPAITTGMEMRAEAGFAICDVLEDGLVTSFAPLYPGEVMKTFDDAMLRGFD